MNNLILKHFPNRPMLIRYWQARREIEDLRHQIDHRFEDLAPFGQQSNQSPAIELKDEGDSLVLRAQLPGIEAKDLDIQVRREAVTIAAEYRHEQKTQEKEVFRSEFRYGKFRRVVPLPVAVENNQVQAEYKDGLLSLILPKAAEVRNQVVKLNLTEVLGQARNTESQATDEPIANASSS